MDTTQVAAVSAVAFVASFVLAYKVKRAKHLGTVMRQTLGDACGVLLAVSLLVLGEALLQRAIGTSFYHLWQNGSAVPLQIFVIGAAQGIAYEYVGQFTFPLWIYPAAEKRRWMLLGLPLFYGIYMFVMQDTWAILRHAGLNAWGALFATALIQYAIIEGFNLLTHSWKYLGRFNRVPALILGWIVLTLTFVVANNNFFGKPFGY